MPKTLRTARRILLTGLAIYWLVIAAGTHVPSHAVGNPWVNDKVLHAGAFTGLSVLLCWCILKRRPTMGRAVWVLAIALLYGVLDEVTQAWVPTRSADLYDWLADAGGTVAGMGVYYASWRTLSWISRRRGSGWRPTIPLEPRKVSGVGAIETTPGSARTRRPDAA